MAIAIEVKQQLSKELAQHLDTMARLQVPMDAIGAEVLSQTQERITQDQESPDGSPWPEWSDDYKKSRAGSGGAFLDASGELIDSLDYSASNDEVIVGSNLVYAATHQFGDDERNIPARAYLGINMQNELAILRIAQDAVQKQIDKVSR